MASETVTALAESTVVAVFGYQTMYCIVLVAALMVEATVAIVLAVLAVGSLRLNFIERTS